MRDYGPGMEIQVSPNTMFQGDNSSVRLYRSRTKRGMNQNTSNSLLETSGRQIIIIKGNLCYRLQVPSDILSLLVGGV